MKIYIVVLLALSAVTWVTTPWADSKEQQRLAPSVIVQSSRAGANQAGQAHPMSALVAPCDTAAGPVCRPGKGGK